MKNFCPSTFFFAVMVSFACFIFALPSRAQSVSSLAPPMRQFVKVSSPIIALEHVRVIDGTGSAPHDDQTIVISNGTIQSISDAANAAVPPGARVLDLPGETAIPGLVGMHEHLFYPSGGRIGIALYNEMGFSFPRLYLACGITSMRTTGAIEPYTDLELKNLIDAGKLVGPDIHVTSPYLEGAGAFTPQMHQLTAPADATRTVNYWADEGVTSFKAYMHITRAELAAAIAAVHERHLKITGHLCAVGFKEAATLGIDNLEHGLMVDTEFDPGKKPDVCPSQQLTAQTLSQINVEGARVQSTIHDLVAHHVAVTSTLPVFETFVPDEPPLESRALDALVPEAAISYLAQRAVIAQQPNSHSPWPVLLKKEMEFEYDFVKDGGLLMAGEDPTGYGGDLAGFGDQREMELLVKAGFTPEEAIHIYTENGARFLGVDNRVGTLAVGKQADIVVINGNPAKNIHDIEKTELVFKDGVGYDSVKLIASVRGSVGLH